MTDIVERLRSVHFGLTHRLALEAADEIVRLRQWEAQAMAVLAEWEDVWVAAGCPGELGRSKAAGMFDFVRNAQEDPS